MRKNQSSLTAAGIAIVCAIESEKPADERICYDPYARQFVPAWMYHILGFFIKSGHAELRGPGVNGFLIARERYITKSGLFYWQKCHPEGGRWLWYCNWKGIVERHGGRMKADAFRDQVVIVTGASSGIGRALALQLAGQGAKVVLAARRAKLLEQVAAACRHAGGEALSVPTDVADEAQCKALVEKTVAMFDRLDMLVNNAGLTVIARLEDYSNLSLFQHTMDVNFYGAVYCTYYALPYLIRSRGRIVAVSSLGGKAPLPYNSPYIASKFAMHGFFDSLRIELRRHGVSVTIICPYWVVTGFHEAQMDKDGVPRGPGGRAIYSKNMMTAERCAQVSLQAAYRRRREVLMGPGRLVAWLKLLTPGLLDRILVAFLKATVRRGQKNASPS